MTLVNFANVVCLLVQRQHRTCPTSGHSKNSNHAGSLATPTTAISIMKCPGPIGPQVSDNEFIGTSSNGFRLLNDGSWAQGLDDTGVGRARHKGTNRVPDAPHHVKSFLHRNIRTNLDCAHSGRVKVGHSPSNTPERIPSPLLGAVRGHLLRSCQWNHPSHSPQRATAFVHPASSFSSPGPGEIVRCERSRAPHPRLQSAFAHDHERSPESGVAAPGVAGVGDEGAHRAAQGFGAPDGRVLCHDRKRRGCELGCRL